MVSALPTQVLGQSNIYSESNSSSISAGYAEMLHLPLLHICLFKGPRNRQNCPPVNGQNLKTQRCDSDSLNPVFVLF